MLSNTNIYYYVIEIFCDGYEIEKLIILLTIVFWKRLDHNWLLERNGDFYMPEQSKKSKYSHLPINNDVFRQDKYLDIELNLTELGKLEDVFQLIKKDNNPIKQFFFAGKYYCRALQNIDYDVEIAYIDLIRCIEILGGTEKISEDDFDWVLKEIYLKIQDEPKLVKYFAEYHWATKKFCDTVLTYLDTNILNHTESLWSEFSLLILKDKDLLKAVIKNAYTIRSWYLHKGLSFWSHVIPYRGGLNELINSRPWEKNPNNGCLVIQKTLTYMWLERIVRNVLFNFLKKNIVEMEHFNL